MRFFVLLIVALLSACDRTPTVPPLLFSVSRNGGIEGYLLGTLHHGAKLSRTDLAAIERLLARSSSLHVERDMRDAEMSKQFGTLIGAPFGGKAWSHIVPSHEFVHVSSLADKAGIELSSYLPSQLHPIFLVDAAFRRCDPPSRNGGYSMDAELQKTAMQIRLPVSPIETADEAAAPLLELPFDGWRDYLERADRFIEPACEKAVAKYMTATLESYKRRDVEAVRDASLEMHRISGLDAVHTPMIFGRDAKLSANVVRAMRAHKGGASKVFVTIGAAHLAGSDGALQSLERAGYTVRLVDRLVE